MTELYYRVLNGKEMPDERQTSMLVAHLKGKGDARNCNNYSEVTLLTGAMV